MNDCALTDLRSQVILRQGVSSLHADWAIMPADQAVGSGSPPADDWVRCRKWFASNDFC
ncbi:MAG: hypothetical protein MUF06_00460 [Pirellulaceae bacterium]|nr:hypothetical protein [Pirellulaceae bacterium]